jgi:hypothetical protein
MSSLCSLSCLSVLPKSFGRLGNGLMESDFQEKSLKTREKEKEAKPFFPQHLLPML